MPVNADKPNLWKADVSQSVDFYNNWFLQFAPKAFRETRQQTAEEVKKAFGLTYHLQQISTDILKRNPTILSTLRMATAPPIARDRLIGLSGVTPNLVKSMELKGRVPPRMGENQLNQELARIGKTFDRLLDSDLFPWLGDEQDPKPLEIDRAASVVADRLCGAQADPIIRNAQERRQLGVIRRWLEARGYVEGTIRDGSQLQEMSQGTFSFRLNVPVIQFQEGGGRTVNIPIDAVVMPNYANPDEFPLLIEAKSAGDFTNTNKRRKEEAIKITQLRSTYGEDIRFILFLCGYFDSGYLGYEAAEGIDWVWEHRIDDLSGFGL